MNKKFILLLFKDRTFDTILESKALNFIIKNRNIIEYILIPMFNESMYSYICIDPYQFRDDFIYAIVTQTLCYNYYEYDDSGHEALGTQNFIVSNIFEMYRIVAIYHRMESISEIINSELPDYWQSVDIEKVSIRITFQGNNIKELKFDIDAIEDDGYEFDLKTFYTSDFIHKLQAIFECDDKLEKIYFDMENKRWDYSLIPLADNFVIRYLGRISEYAILNLKWFAMLSKVYELPIYISLYCYGNEYIEDLEKELSNFSKDEFEDKYGGYDYFIHYETMYTPYDFIQTLVIFDSLISFLNMQLSIFLEKPFCYSFLVFEEFSNLTNNIQNHRTLMFDPYKLEMQDFNSKWFNGGPYSSHYVRKSIDVINIMERMFHDYNNIYRIG